jgi:hypothetical protein
MDFDHDEPTPPSRDGAEWGLASLLLGGVLAIMVPPTLLLILALDNGGFHRFGRLELHVATVAGFVAGASLVALSLAGLAFGVTGLGAARRHRRPTALALAGVLLGAFDLFTWLGAGLAWYATIAGRL